MKRIFSLLLAFIIMLSLCACQGNYGSVNLNDAIEIPEDGMIQESIIAQIQSENAIGIFTGVSNGYQYEWTIFGSDITEVCQINLAVEIDQTAEGDLTVSMEQEGAFGFSACFLFTWKHNGMPKVQRLMQMIRRLPQFPLPVAKQAF